MRRVFSMWIITLSAESFLLIVAKYLFSPCFVAFFYMGNTLNTCMFILFLLNPTSNVDSNYHITIYFTTTASQTQAHDCFVQLINGHQQSPLLTTTIILSLLFAFFVCVAFQHKISQPTIKWVIKSNVIPVYIYLAYFILICARFT